MRRAHGAALLGLVVVVAAVSAFVATDDRPVDSARDKTDRSAPPNQPAHGPDVKTSVVMRPTPQRDLVFKLPQHTFLSVWDPRTGEHREPRRVDGDHYRAPHKDRTQLARGRKVFYVADNQGVIVDVVVFSNARGGSGRLDPLQWVISKDGVQLIWNRKNIAPWSVSRGEKQLASNAPGIYFDPVSSNKSSYYTIRHLENVTVLVDGKPTKAEKDTMYVAIVPGYDARLIGANVNEVGQQSDPGLILKRSAANAVDGTSDDVVAFVEWNSFISDEYVGASLCGVGPSDVAHFAGDGRAWSTIPARDAYTAHGEPRSRLSSRVGVAWASETGVDNDEFADWLYRGIGESHAYDGDYNLIRSARADIEDIKLDASTSGPGTATRTVKAASANPLCKVGGIFGAPEISVEYTLQARRDGLNRVIGEFDRAPDTEILWEAGSDMSDPGDNAGGCLYRYQNRGFQYLAPQMPNVTVDLSFPDGVDPTCPVH